MFLHVVVLALLGRSALSLKWTAIHDGSGTAPSPRRDPALGYDATNNRLVLYGGLGASRFDDTWKYDIVKDEWSELSLSKAPSPRRSVVYGSDAGGLYVATGELGSGEANDAWRFDFSNQTWSQLDQRPCEPDGPLPEPRYGAAGGISPGSNRLYVALGFGDIRYFDTFAYELDQKCWHIVTPGPHNVYNPSYPHARCLHGGAVTGEDQVVIFGGCMGAGGVGGPCPAGDTWQLTKDSGGDGMSWERMESCPIPRIYPTMAALPSAGDTQKAVLYGGVEKSSQVLQTEEISANELGIFDSASETWTLKKTEEDDSPTRRASAAMVTTPDGIFMFGGFAIEGGDRLNDLWKLTGTVEDSVTLDSCNRTFFNLIVVHGALMFLAWGLLLQAGAFIARYLRDEAGRWFKAHIGLQILGLLVAIGGLVCGVLSISASGSTHFGLAHGTIGIIVMVTGLCQPLNAVIRPHIKEDGVRTTARKIWEFCHKNFGRVALLLGLVNVTLGLFIGVAAQSVWITWCVYLCVVVLAYAGFEIRKFLQQSKRKEKISDSGNTPI